MRGNAGTIEAGLLAVGFFIASVHAVFGVINQQYLTLGWSLIFAIPTMLLRFFLGTKKLLIINAVLFLVIQAITFVMGLIVIGLIKA